MISIYDKSCESEKIKQGNFYKKIMSSIADYDLTAKKIGPPNLEMIDQLLH